MYLAFFLASGFAILVFDTNPPPPTPERLGMVEIWRYCLFGLAAFLMGMACYRSVQRFDGGE
jgi:hypothetical protein